MPKNARKKTAIAANKMPARVSAKVDDSRRAKHFGNRYGRSEDARQAVLEAADDLLVEIGFAAVTIEGIAARAGVGKQTIYRWWSSKTDVLLDTFLDDAVEHLTPQDTGDLGRDLRTHLRNLAGKLDAHSKLEVLARARQRGLIADWPAAQTSRRAASIKSTRRRDLAEFPPPLVISPIESDAAYA